MLRSVAVKECLNTEFSKVWCAASSQLIIGGAGEVGQNAKSSSFAALAILLFVSVRPIAAVAFCAVS